MSISCQYRIKNNRPENYLQQLKDLNDHWPVKKICFFFNCKRSSLVENTSLDSGEEFLLQFLPLPRFVFEEYVYQLIGNSFIISLLLNACDLALI
jgi:hypothetical protein